jgi:hypothetical protein
VTQAGCGAICPACRRGCYGCFGPTERPNTSSLSERWLEQGVDRDGIARAYRSFNAFADAFREESERHEPTR